MRFQVRSSGARLTSLSLLLVTLIALTVLGLHGQARADRTPRVEPTGGSTTPDPRLPPALQPGECPNTVDYAYDPRTHSCVQLPPCAGGQIWNPDRKGCVPRPAGNGLECLGGYTYDQTQRRCVPPNCGQEVFDPQAGRCIPPPPVVCPTAQMFDPTKNACVAATYDTLQVIVGTGGDNLGSMSAVWMLWTEPGGKTGSCTLHYNGDGWDNNSSHTVNCDIGPTPMTLAQLQSAKFAIAYNASQSVNFPDTGDNWNLQSVTINGFRQRQPPVCVFSASGNPLHRFQLDRAPSSPYFANTFMDPDLGMRTDDAVVVTDFPNQCP